MRRLARGRPPGAAVRSREPYVLAFNALAAGLAEGRYGWGRPLVATEIAAALHLSPTPVREALARLAGEGLIDHRPGYGYASLAFTGADLADLYTLHELHLLDAVGRTDFTDLPEAMGDDDVRATEGFFRALVLRTGSRALDRAHRRLIAQLGPALRVEARVTGPDRTGLSRQIACYDAQDRVGLIEEIQRWHGRRRQSSRAVVEAMRAADQSIFQI